jgi:hypothetical protein
LRNREVDHSANVTTMFVGEIQEKETAQDEEGDNIL